MSGETVAQRVEGAPPMDAGDLPGTFQRIQLRWNDIDAQGHVYHAVAISLVDEARARWFDEWFDTESTDYVIARVEVDYHRPISRSMGAVDCRIQLARLGNKSLCFDEVVTSPDGELLLTSRSWVVVWDSETRTTRPMTDAERLRIATLRPLRKPETPRSETPRKETS